VELLDQDAVAIQLDQPVAAVRVSWWRDGAREETIVVPRPHHDDAGATGSAVILLGKVDCAGQTVPVADLEHLIMVELVAIRNDGSEIRVDGMPPILEADRLTRVAGPPPVLRIAPPAAPAALAAASAAPRPLEPHGELAVILVAGAIVVGVRRGRANASRTDPGVPTATARRR
jgi:hypothetical protein